MFFDFLEDLFEGIVNVFDPSDTLDSIDVGAPLDGTGIEYSMDPLAAAPMETDIIDVGIDDPLEGSYHGNEIDNSNNSLLFQCDTDGSGGSDANAEMPSEIDDSAETLTDDGGLSTEEVLQVEPRDSILPRNGGEWLGEEGNSEWSPDSDCVPGDRHGTNPDNKTWAEIKADYGFDTIAFIDGEPDFSPLAEGSVDITDFTEDRECNFAQADELLATQRGTSPEEIEQWRHENKYTWHECANCKTMQLVPTEVHGNLSHSGGIAAIKQMRVA